MESEEPQKVQVNRKAAATAAPAKSGLVALWERHANRILLGLTSLVLLYLLIQYRQGAERRATEASWENLASARDKVSQFRSMDLLRSPPDQIAREAVSLEQTAVPVLDAVLTDAGQGTLHAQASVAKGDLYWTLANMPELPGATTQPAMRLSRSASDYLATAEAAYRAAANQKDDPISAATAKFGLAAIAENRGQWDAARSLYNELGADDNALLSVKSLAIARAAQVDQLRRPLYVSPATVPATAPTTSTSTTMPSQ